MGSKKEEKNESSARVEVQRDKKKGRSSVKYKEKKICDLPYLLEVWSIFAIFFALTWSGTVCIFITLKLQKAQRRITPDWSKTLFSEWIVAKKGTDEEIFGGSSFSIKRS